MFILVRGRYHLNHRLQNVLLCEHTLFLGLEFVLFGPPPGVPGTSTATPSPIRLLASGFFLLGFEIGILVFNNSTCLLRDRSDPTHKNCVLSESRPPETAIPQYPNDFENKLADPEASDTHDVPHMS